MSSLLTSGFWHERSTAPTHQPAAEHPPQAPTARTRFASTAPTPLPLAATHLGSGLTGSERVKRKPGRRKQEAGTRVVKHGRGCESTGSHPMRPWRRSVCAPFARKAGVRLRVKYLGPRYVRAKNRKSATTTLKCWRFKTRFFASFLFAFEKK